MTHAIWMNDNSASETSSYQQPARPIRCFTAREKIKSPHSDVRPIYRIETGTVVLSCRLPDGRRQIVELLGPGMYFTADELIVSDAEALTPVTLRVLRHRKALESGPLRQEIDAQLRKRMAAMRRHAVLLGRKTATERLCSFLLECSTPPSNQNANQAAGTMVQIDLSQGDIADYLGLGSETVCRELKKLKTDGLIAFSRDGVLTLFDRDALVAMSEQVLPPKPYRSERSRLRSPRQAATIQSALHKVGG